MTTMMLQQARPQDGHEHDLERQVGDDQEEVGEAHEQARRCARPGSRPRSRSIPPITMEMNAAEKPDDEGDARAVDEAGQDVLAAVVGPEQVLAEEGVVDVVDGDRRGGVGVVGGEHRREDRHEQGEPSMIRPASPTG